MTELTKTESAQLAECEATIERGLGTFVEVGQALAKIRASRLYLETHDTFEDYCQERWQLKRQRAYELIQAASVVSEISDNPPATESHAAALAKVPESERADVWREANERTNGKPTAAVVKKVREERKPQKKAKPKPKAKPERDLVSKNMRISFNPDDWDAFKNISEQRGETMAAMLGRFVSETAQHNKPAYPLSEEELGAKADARGRGQGKAACLTQAEPK